MSTATKTAATSRFGAREEWLNAFIVASRPQFAKAGFPLPENVRASIGFTSGGRRGKSIGECWGTVASGDGHFEIFLRPSLNRDARLADVLTHELIHAAVGLEAKHGPVFKRCAVALGLEGKMTATIAGKAWHTWAQPILRQLGPMPGASLKEMQTTVKKQTTRMLKCACADCGFTFRASARWATTATLRCPDPECDGTVVVEGAGEGE